MTLMIALFGLAFYLLLYWPNVFFFTRTQLYERSYSSLKGYGGIGCGNYETPVLHIIGKWLAYWIFLKIAQKTILSKKFHRTQSAHLNLVLCVVVSLSMFIGLYYVNDPNPIYSYPNMLWQREQMGFPHGYVEYPTLETYLSPIIMMGLFLEYGVRRILLIHKDTEV